jgi:hypothetical protein
MSKLNNIIRIWKAKGQILEGVANSIFKKEHVEEIATYRALICTGCSLYDSAGVGCMVPGTGPCCNMMQGGCGCSLKLKTRSLSSSCPHPDGPKWEAELTQEEEDAINKQTNQ